MKPRLMAVLAITFAVGLPGLLITPTQASASATGSIVRAPLAGMLGTSISTGTYHTCGIQLGGAVLCWGDNTFGALDGTDTVATTIASAPGGGHFKEISAGSYFTCGIHTDGSTLCWGYDFNGQVDGIPTSSSDSKIAQPPGGGNFVQISAGGSSACGIQLDGSAVCWGDDAFGQLDGIPSSSTHIATPPGFGPLSSFTSISVGYRHACGIHTDGSLECWGDDTFGELDGTPSSATTASPPVAGAFTQVSASRDGFHNCALRVDGTVLCWGGDKYGQVNGTVAQSGVAIGSPPGGGAYLQVAAGGNHSCGLRANGTVFCWGDDTYGQVDGSPQSTSPAMGSAYAGKAIAVATGGGHSCAVKINGRMFCWGSDYQGQVDAVPNTIQPYFASGAPASASQMTQPAVSAGGSHVCRISSGAKVTCTGDDTYGQLDGSPGTGHSGTPPGNLDFVQVSAGQNHSCGLTASRTLVCWGRDNAGQTDSPPGHFIQVAAGGGHSCALQPTGTAVCWGDENYVVPGPFIDISTGTNHTCAVLWNFRVECWGDNSSNQATPTEYQPSIQVAGGATHTCVLQIDSSLACWGDNSSFESTPPYGQFDQVATGTGDTCGLSLAARLVCWGANGSGQADAPPGDFTSVSAGGQESCGVSANGSVVCWGNEAGYSPTGGAGYSALAVRRSSSGTSIRWRGARHAVGYNVLVHHVPINAHLIRSKTRRYHFHTSRRLKHFKLAPVLKLS